MQPELEQYAVSVLGPLTETRPVRVSPSAAVVTVVDATGERWYVKRPGTPAQWRNELRAHRHWVPRLYDGESLLRAVDEERRLMVLRDVPGVEPPAFRASVHRRAGAVLRTLHDTAAPRAARAVEWDRIERRAEHELERCRRLSVPVDAAFVMSCVRSLRELGLPWVPCHGDYQPHNWLLAADRQVRVIDFGESRWHARPWDLARLAHGPWWRRFDLMHAFLDGYGRPLTDEELRFVELHLALNAVTALAWGSEHHVRSVRDRGREVLGALRVGDVHFRPRSRVRRTASRVRERLVPRTTLTWS